MTNKAFYLVYPTDAKPVKTAAAGRSDFGERPICFFRMFCSLQDIFSAGTAFFGFSVRCGFFFSVGENRITVLFGAKPGISFCAVIFFFLLMTATGSVSFDGSGPDVQNCTRIKEEFL